MSRGFGFVTYCKAESVQAAMQMGTQHEISVGLGGRGWDR